MDLFQREMPLNEADPNNLLMHVNRHLERIAGLSSLTINDLKQAILGDPVLKAALTGPSIPNNFGGSLLVNSSLELGNLSQWSGGILGDDYLGYKSISTDSNLECLTNPYFNPNRIYCIKGYYKSLAAFNIGCYGLDLEGNNKDKGNGGFIVFSSTLPQSNTFVQFCHYVGGIGLASYNFPIGSIRVKLAIINVSSNVQLNQTSLYEIPLGEPVPFNLPFLPSGQMVFDPTDGSVGRYDGTTIHWFTME